MSTNKQFLANYLIKSLTFGEGHHLVGLSSKVVMDKFSTLTFELLIFLSRSTMHFLHVGMETMDSLMAHKNQLCFQICSW